MEEQKTDSHLVFVYGTLMKNARNHLLMKEAKLIEDGAVTKDNSFLMLQFNSSSSPGKQTPAVLRGGDGFIKGEVYKVGDDGLAKLDDLEQNGVRYQREEIEMQDGTMAWIYVLIIDEDPSYNQDRILFENKIYSWRREEVLSI